MQAVLSNILQVQRQLQEKHLRAEERMTRFEDSLAETKRIVERTSHFILTSAEASDRRIAAIDNQLRQLIQIVGCYAESTNERLDILENRDSD